MSITSTEEQTAARRIETAKLIRESLIWQPALSAKVWDIYLDPYSFRITVVVDRSIRFEIQQRFSWVSDIEFVSFDNAISIFKFKHQLIPNKFGLPLSELEGIDDFLKRRKSKQTNSVDRVSELQLFALQQLVLTYSA